jgi:regulator of replication initiation timing
MERANRSIKANIIMSTAAGANLDPYYEKKEDEDGSVIMYNQGADIPQVLKEAFETGDLTNIIQTSRELIADVIGIPLAGILGSEDKTATEILIQNNNKQSNVAIFYENAYKACRTFGRIVIEMLTGGYDLNFDLTNGPDVITNNMKHRQELQAVASLLPQEMQPLVAVHMCDTVDSQFVDSIKADIIANLGDQLKIVSEQPTDPIAIHELEQMKNMLDQSMQKLEEIQQENSQLKLQNQSMSLQLQSREIENQIHIYDSQNKWDIERAKLGIEESKTAVDNNVKITEAQADLAEKALDASQKRLDILEDSMAVTTSEV